MAAATQQKSGEAAWPDSSLSAAWHIEEQLAEVEDAFASLFDDQAYHGALREVLSPGHREAIGQLHGFNALTRPAQKATVDAVFAAVKRITDADPTAALLRQKLLAESAAKEAIRRHLSAIPVLDRKITKKMFAPKRSVLSLQRALMLGAAVAVMLAAAFLR